MTLNLNRTNFQAQVRSKPLRENEIDIENAYNDLQSQVSALATAATGTFAEITNARDYHSVLRDRLRSLGKGVTNTIISGGAVTPNANTQKVDVALGEAVVAGVGCKWTAQTSGTLAASTSGSHRVDIVAINSDNSLSVVLGGTTATANAPDIPPLASSQAPLAYLYIPDTIPVNITGDIYSKYNLVGKNVMIDYTPNAVHYLTPNATGYDVSFDLTIDDLSLVGNMTLIVSHGATACNMRFSNTAYHINVDNAVQNQLYVLPSGTGKRTIFQTYFDETDLYIMENPFYVVS